MNNYDNIYSSPGYQPNGEFNPMSNFEMEDFENEFNNENAYEQEYGLSPEYDFEQNYEFENDYEDEVRDHRRGAIHAAIPGSRYHSNTPRAVVTVPSRFGPRQPYYRQVMPGTVYRQSPRNWNSNYYRYSGLPWYQRHHRYQNWPYTPGADYSGQPSSYAGDSGSNIPAPGDTGNNIPGYLIDTIQKLSQQVAATSANVDALQKSIASPGNVPSADNSPAQGAAPANAGQPSTGASDHEMETYEYEMENEMMNYEQDGHEVDEMELAAELLATNNESELDYFLGGLVGGSLKKLLNGVIKKALPIAGAATGTFFGGPLGASIGEKIGSAASGMFGLELEGLSNEDQEFEVARAIIRLAKDAAAELTNNGNTGDPDRDAKNALIQSAMHNAPGLLVRKNHHGGHDGHWHRRGNRIIIDNAF